MPTKSFIASLSDVLKRIQKFGKRFGHARGLLLWFRLRQHVRKQQGARHVVQVPGLHHPVTLRAMTSDVEVFHQIFVDGELEFDLHMLPSRIIDAGANIGLAAVYFSSRFPEAKILALEVETANFELLRHNTAFYPNITCLKKALWSGPANLSIANPTAESMSFQVSPSAKGDEEGILAVGVKDLAEMFRGDGARPGVVGVGMSAVVLHLKREYWDAIRDGIKREEYRARGPYWGRRIRNKDFSEVILLCGYPKRGDDSLMIRRK